MPPVHVKHRPSSTRLRSFCGGRLQLVPPGVYKVKGARRWFSSILDPLDAAHSTLLSSYTLTMRQTVIFTLLLCAAALAAPNFEPSSSTSMHFAREDDAPPPDSVQSYQDPNGMQHSPNDTPEPHSGELGRHDGWLALD